MAFRRKQYFQFFIILALVDKKFLAWPNIFLGRVLVAAYWLFVVLMLATFTANLAAFLTVERMQTTVAGLEELAQQSKINYTVVEDSPYYEYFQNMASAEEDLYKKWKDMTLSRLVNPKPVKQGYKALAPKHDRKL